MTHYTKNQRIALEWLPADGSWAMDAGRMTAKLSSLRMYYTELINEEYGQFGARGGWKTRWRLTAAGVAARTALGA